MTNQEICQVYRQAKNKKQQIEILSDLALKTKEEIEEILIAGGESVNLTNNRKRKQVENKDVLKEQGLPEEIQMVLQEKLDQIDLEIKELNRKIEEREKLYREIAGFMKSFYYM